MSDIWKFAASSEPAMERCVSMAGPRDKRNKWLQEFKQKHCDSDFGNSLYRLLKGTQEALDAKEDELLKKDKLKEEYKYDEFYESVEAEPIARFDFMLEQGSKHIALFQILAERLSEPSVEKICKHLFETKIKNTHYVTNFYRNFFPVYLKRPYSCFSLDILVKANKAHPSAFRQLLQTLLKDPEISNIMINDFVATLNAAGSTEFLNMVIELELTAVEFANHLISIYSAYKTCEKPERIQTYVYNSLVKYSTDRANDWNYGRLLLAYLHASNEAKSNLDLALMERLIERHQTPYKRPCITVLREMEKRLNTEVVPPNPA